MHAAIQSARLGTAQAPITTSASSQQSAAFGAQTYQIRVCVVSNPCWIKIGDNPTATVAQLCRASGHSADRVAAAVTVLAVDGVVRAGPAALDGRPRGRVRLGD